ncbi:NAD(P)H-dependent oxidoreductase subunit E [Leucothrix mucor]|uniref:NAD(P)H-dependent oxidoreductase subunit E n=1 Tax=Leucothrix mucor TaxID=45248 RepID=UPI0003B5E2A1|nr:NAD(P)H-dependent oxidoreductase subunit E [Leucothrix mucor]
MAKQQKAKKWRGRGLDQDALEIVSALIADLPMRRDLLIEYLHRIQDDQGCLHAAQINALATLMKISQTEVYEVASFYHHFDIVKEGDEPPPALTVRVCESVSCSLFGSEQLISSLQAEYGDSVRIQPVPCVGRCESAPVAVVGQLPIAHATTEKVIECVNAGTTTHHPDPYIGYEQYLAEGGYATYKACRANHVTEEHVLTMLEDSNLRGLGGAGFPVGRKWHIVRDMPDPKLMAVNIDEGEPGTFKDRYYLERDPHRFLEGMLIAADVVGIKDVYIYLRDEYADIRHILETELDIIREQFPLDLPTIQLRRGAGAYICGEESAMIESIEGKRGMPRLRPPFVAEVGLFGRPTLEHNMESLYWVRDLIERGVDWFVDQGRHNRKGMRSFSVSGRVNKPGVHFAPAGITMNELIEEYCGGMPEGHTFYGYYPGGASGGILPASLGDVPLDFDTLQAHGSFIGSAAVVVLSDQDSARDCALNSMKFFEHESCGQCTPCRVGTSKAVQLMQHEHWDTALMKELSEVMVDASICGLGQAAPNPMQSVIKYFPKEVHK